MALAAAAPAIAAGGSLLGGVGSLVGGKKGASAITQAAQLQSQAALRAAQIQQQEFGQVQGWLSPFQQMGTGAIPQLEAFTGTGPGGGGIAASPFGQLMTPGTWSPTMNQLQQMPGYQFELQQSLQAAQANQAASGLGRSGSATKAAAQYAQGLAASDWQANFAQWLQNKQLGMQGGLNQLNALTGQVGTGLSAAGALGGVGIQTAQNIGQAIQGAAAAQAGGLTGAAQAQIGGFQGLAGGIGTAPLGYMMTSMLANQAGATPGGGGAFGGANPLGPYQ